MSLLRRIEQRPPSDFQDRHALREWWQNILRDYDHRYSCSAIFIILPSDKEAIRYLSDFGTEIDIISGDDCLIIVLGKAEFKRSGIDEKIQRPTVSERLTSFLEETWKVAIKCIRQEHSGQSLLLDCQIQRFAAGICLSATSNTVSAMSLPNTKSHIFWDDRRYDYPPRICGF